MSNKPDDTEAPNAAPPDAARDTTPPPSPSAGPEEGNFRDSALFGDVRHPEEDAFANDPVNSQILAQAEAIRAAAERGLTELKEAALALTVGHAAGLAILNAVQAQQSDAMLATALLGRSVAGLRAAVPTRNAAADNIGAKGTGQHG